MNLAVSLWSSRLFISSFFTSFMAFACSLASSKDKTLTRHFRPEKSSPRTPSWTSSPHNPLCPQLPPGLSQSSWTPAPD
jgi:hypothetical protein